jgi:hypothetical protein
VATEIAKAQLKEKGYCVLRQRFDRELLERCREAFWPTLTQYVASHESNRGPHRFFLSMPFEPPCFAPEFFFDEEVASIVRGALGEHFVADQWGCDVPVLGSTYQEVHRDYQRPLFEEMPDLVLPPYMLVLSFGLVDIGLDDGPIEIANEPVTLALGDVLIRHPWTLHRGTPNRTPVPRALCTIRYVRRWYADASREVATITRTVWQSLTQEQQERMRFPVESGLA